MKISLCFILLILVLLCCTFGISAQAPPMKPAATKTAPDLAPVEVALSASAAAEYQILDLRHQLALSQFNGKIAEFLATPEMLELRANVLGFQSGLRSRALTALEAAHVKPEDFEQYHFVADGAGGKFVRSK